MKDRKSIDTTCSVPVSNTVTRRQSPEQRMEKVKYSMIRDAGADGDNLARNKSS